MTVADLLVAGILTGAAIALAWPRRHTRDDLHSLRYNERIRNQLRRGK